MKYVHVLITEIATKVISIPVDDTVDKPNDYAEAEAERMLLDGEIDMTVDADVDRTFDVVGGDN